MILSPPLLPMTSSIRSTLDLTIKVPFLEESYPLATIYSGAVCNLLRALRHRLRPGGSVEILLTFNFRFQTSSRGMEMVSIPSIWCRDRKITQSILRAFPCLFQIEAMKV